MTACYFVTDDRRGPHFISPKSEKADELINSARVVLVENDIPETLQPNGTFNSITSRHTNNAIIFR